MARRDASAARLTAMDLKTLLDGPFDRPGWEAVSSEHLHLRIGNEPPTVDRTASLDQFAAFRSRILGFGCRYCELWQRREAIYAETDVHFLTTGGARAEIPCALVARVTSGLLQDLRFHLDPSPIP